MRISIAMATYNGAKYLQEQLDSFLNQVRLPDELVVCDDGSTDSTLEIIERFAKSAPFDVRYSSNEENLGYSANFNEVLLKTTGDLVFLSDQDDVWFKGKIECIEKLSIEKSNYLLYMNDAAIADDVLNDSGRTKLGQFRGAGFSNENFVTGCCCAVRRELLDFCMPVPKGFKGHDRWIARFADGMGSKLISERVLQYYRRHGSNASSSIFNSTKEFSYWDGFKIKLNNVYKNSEYGQSAAQQQLVLLIHGVERALASQENKYHQQLNALLAKVNMELAEEDVRQVIRGKSLLLRVIAVGRHLINGNYRKSSCVKSAARDLLG